VFITKHLQEYFMFWSISGYKTSFLFINEATHDNFHVFLLMYIWKKNGGDNLLVIFVCVDIMCQNKECQYSKK
jgi:hypothetical protein